MALLKIARMGHPVLLQRAEPVADPAAPEIRRLAADMIETMADAGGVGLAAPQVHVPLRLFVMRDGDSARVFVNPVIAALDGAVEEGWEGCLSIPGLRGLVPRARRLAWEADDTEGRRLAGEAEGLSARVIQHEVDHLDGLLYLMRMHDLRQLGFQEEVARHAARPASPEPAR
ncbi:peptide deformylase [Roseomonas sp. OT10]|uniref:peptide deformylase n=1 Tax=Roseomonas cutis TaxID=2897332 RepID=UPI001E51950E|nr:peptide deformylase [Roseomonas sp. OT10]UFN49655.1 peptide deformylase [Roseomonas sp. OT10]